ncbi:fatty-acyl-CoA synthase [Actinocorallia herbida]|uniref:Fatty-acyl-CoA synthase n=1 Tax=Actinocorallia herbida TaxID=58109 RepID=A0A3N1CYK1_9ACTN|nr:long-chain-fatty-acid--CoA ligase [Actinocorallia herbida]ROO86367.1 fatty-acyl-CoA synthase [Actinocorallia herbida]
MTSTAQRPDGAGTHWVDSVARHAHGRPDRIALRFEGASTTYRDLHTRLTALAGALHARGVTHGDRVAILMTNRPEFAETLLAISRLGAIGVPVNFRLTAPEVVHIITDSGAKALITEAALAPLAAEARASAPVAALVVAGPTDVPGTLDYATLLAEGALPPTVQVADTDTALIMYTSGTTGAPKGAMLTHLNLLMQSFTVIRHWRLFGDDEVGLLASPLFHIAAVGCLAPHLLIGATTVIVPSGAFDAAATLDLIDGEGVTNAFFVPAQWQLLCDDPSASSRAGSLRIISWGAAPATVTLLERMAATFPQAANVAVFGQTEMSPVTCALDAADALRKIGSIGRPIPTVSARVVDGDMNDVAPGEVGEIVYRGPSTMQGYWNNPAATAEAFAGGWFHSGDLVRADEEGFLYVVDRKKDMIISGGENIYCAEVENVLAAHPGVGEVSVIGVPHPKWGETPLAVVVTRAGAPAPTLESLTDFCRDRLASYKKPTALVVVDALPRNASGKVLKHELRAAHSG